MTQSAITAPEGALTETAAKREIDRALESRKAREEENDARMERSIRIAMAAKEDSEGNCFYCGKRLDVEQGEPKDGRIPVIKLHPMPYLECHGPSGSANVTASGRIQPKFVALAVAPKPLPDLKPVQRPYGQRDD